jgi:hypothetical protein
MEAGELVGRVGQLVFEAAEGAPAAKRAVELGGEGLVRDGLEELRHVAEAAPH